MNGATPTLTHTPALWGAEGQFCLPWKTGLLTQERLLQT